MSTTTDVTAVNGARLHHEILGPPPEDAPALVCLHGAPGLGDCREQVRIIGGALAGDLRMLFYDARGSGRSEDAPPYTHAQWVADLDELTRLVGMERFALLGHSYGGIMAQEYAIAHPERLTHLVLVDTAPSTVENDASIARALASGLPGMEEGWLRRLFEGRVESDAELREMWERLLPLYFEGPIDPDLPRQIAADTFFHFETHNFAFSVNNPAFDVRDRLAGVRVPALVICGDEDWITPLAKSEDIAARLPDARLEVFEHCGHMPLAEAPERFTALVRDFVVHGGAR